ncbi:MAG TPA: efflux RND transporter periplasmic adaptor subunit [Xanthomonadaceae bacterium]|nr:efflux RND transporter periplasmic adaptor subunit [Xanthomonadaceae bacterium]
MKRFLLLGLALGFAVGALLGGWAVWRGQPAALEPASVAAPAARQVLYYRNPMGLPDTSPVPKKDSMGMDYIPVFVDESPQAPGTVALSPERIQMLGVREAPVDRRRLQRRVRASGSLTMDESRQFAVAPRFEGWVERLYANRTGAFVRRGEALLAVYSPELLSTQSEYRIARDAQRALAASDSESAGGMQSLADAALARLRSWQIDEAQLRQLDEPGGSRLLILRSPADAVIVGKRVVEGQRFMAGETILELADLSQVWLLAEVPAQDAGWIAPDQRAAFTSPALPGQRFEGTVEFIYPTIDATTRTIRVRIPLDNRDGELRPALFGDVWIVAETESVLAVPQTAVLDSGTRRVALVALGGGRFMPREVETGRSDDTHVEILAGLAEHESVVVSANFLIDAESNLRAALSGFDAHQGHDDEPPRQSDDPATHDHPPDATDQPTTDPASDPTDPPHDHGAREDTPAPPLEADHDHHGHRTHGG